jgi:hypothetical protein
MNLMSSSAAADHTHTHTHTHTHPHTQAGSWEEALAIENGNPFGNAACIYTTVGAHAQYFSHRFRAAMVGVNIGIPVPREPFSFGGLYGAWVVEGGRLCCICVDVRQAFMREHNEAMHARPHPHTYTHMHIHTGTQSKYGDFDITGEGALNFFTNLRKITSKWPTGPLASSTAAAAAALAGPRNGEEHDATDRANFNGQM